MKQETLRLGKLLFIMLLTVSSTASATEKVKSTDGVEIAYSVLGAGEPALVFVHGWSCDKSYWDEQVKTFSAKHKVVTIDLAGHGESGLERKNYTRELFGDDVKSVVEKLNLGKVILIGHSMGGGVIIDAANKLKGKVIGLIGADTFQNLGITLPADQREPFLKPFKDNFAMAIKEFVKGMFTKTTDSLLIKKIADDMSSAPPQVAISSMENMLADDGVSALKELNVPIISINCDRYPILEESNRKWVKNYKVKMMPGSGHFVMLDNPKLFDQLLQESIVELTTRRE